MQMFIRITQIRIRNINNNNNKLDVSVTQK